jgi:hypothetical protein
MDADLPHHITGWPLLPSVTLVSAMTIRLRACSNSCSRVSEPRAAATSLSSLLFIYISWIIRLRRGAAFGLKGLIDLTSLNEPLENGQEFGYLLSAKMHAVVSDMMLRDGLNEFNILPPPRRP